VELDRRGIVSTIISKNDRDAALPVLTRLGLAEYFVFPQISWKPKSQAVMDLAAAFNVGANTIAVVDDSPFERAEISAQCEGVRVYDESAVGALEGLPEFRPPLSEESSRRREFYRSEEHRFAEKTVFRGDYLDFLRGCRMRIVLDRPTPATVSRAHELIQRTNQLNFSGNRYDRDEIARIVSDPEILSLTVSAFDRFGDYGLVGFCVVHRATFTITDLMFSCRVQAKRVEHAFLIALMNLARSKGATSLRARYRRTARNGQAGQVFDDLGFDLLEDDVTSGRRVYAFGLDAGVPEQDVIAVSWADSE
jgi:FkbH-like protein